MTGHWKYLSGMGGAAVGTILVGVVLVATILIVFIGAVRMVANIARDLRAQDRRIRSDPLRRRASRPNREPPRNP
jgi:hypothetical protein